jgi:hypothetical protein
MLIFMYIFLKMVAQTRKFKNSDHVYKASSEALIPGPPYRDHVAQGRKQFENSHARAASQRSPLKDPVGHEYRSKSNVVLMLN